MLKNYQNNLSLKCLHVSQAPFGTHPWIFFGINLIFMELKWGVYLRSGAKKMSNTFARISPLPDMIAQVLKALRVPEIISINLMYKRPI